MKNAKYFKKLEKTLAFEAVLLYYVVKGKGV